MPFGLDCFENIPFEFRVPEFDRTEEGITEEETQHVLEVLSSFKEQKVTIDTFPIYELSRMNVYVEGSNSGLSFPFVDG